MIMFILCFFTAFSKQTTYLIYAGRICNVVSNGEAFIKQDFRKICGLYHSSCSCLAWYLQFTAVGVYNLTVGHIVGVTQSTILR